MSYTKVGKNKYRIFISDGTNLDGSRKRHSTTVETNLKGRDLERFLMLAEFDFEDEIKKKDPKFDELAKGTLENYANWWLDYKVEHEEIEATTKDYYKKRINDRIIPFAGKQILEKLTNGDMLELMKMIRESPAKTKSGKLSPKSIKHYHTVLSTMFSDACKLKILDENPMENITVKAPKVKVKDNYYDFDDIKKLLALLSKHASIKHILAVLLTMSMGNRGGELTAIRWGKIDFGKAQIRLDEANAYTPEAGSYIKDTKNESSERSVKFPPILVSLFLAHEQDEILKKKMLGKDWKGAEDHKDDFVFTQANGKPMFVGSLPKWFRKFIERHNLKHITFHGLRHTNSTVLIAKGINIVSIAHNLGHALPSTTTDLYSHHLESVEDIMANIFQEIITEDLENEIGTQSGSQEQKLRLIK